MAIAFGTKAENHTEGVTSLTITKPASTVEGNLLIAHIHAVGSDANAHSAPAGWTEILQQAQSTDIKDSWWWKIAGGSEAADYAFTKTGGNADMVGAIMRFTGTFSGNPIDASASGSSETTDPICPTITTTVADTVIIAACGGYDSQSYVAPAGMTERYDVGYNDTSPGYYAISGHTVAQAGAGATGTKTIDASTNSRWAFATIAIKESGSVAHTLTPGDTITLSDAISKEPGPVFADTITMSESPSFVEVEDPGTTGVGSSGGAMYIVHRRRRRRR